MACSSPFQLSSTDAQAFQNTDAFYNNVGSLPPWGGIFVWNGRLILVAFKADGSYIFSDITGGIPWAQAQGGCIPGQAFLKAFANRDYVSPTEAFFMSLPSNFMDIAKQTYDQIIAAGTQIFSDASDAASKPIFELILPVAIAAIAILYLMNKH